MAGSDDDEPVMADDSAAQPGGPPRSLDEAEIRGPLGNLAHAGQDAISGSPPS